ncbi:MAG: UbiX family flavin prenyltransferase [Planctomycetaceae bacterium]|jgi:4-hydroxy-3-polyprenylbenzoate decarboxylase|nr:UbiX family flavin prenyltransferase [Planctomycetaceae bacterium]
MSEKKFVVGLTGASGSLYAVRLVQTLLNSGHEIHLIASPAAVDVFALEMKWNRSDFPAMFRQVFAADFFETKFLAKLHFHKPDDFSASIASGSFPTDGMVVVPCSGGSLAAIAAGINRHLIHRAAEVHLKERRRLVLVLRETPYSLIHIENMAALTRAGAVILPASPPFYHQPETMTDLVDAIVVRILDQLGVEHSLTTGRWK